MEPVAETLLSDTAFCEDIVWGLENIGKIIGQKPHQVHYMLRNGQLPGGQLGKNKWYSSRRALKQFMLDKAAKRVSAA
ncbi:hypothetical protein [Sinorhizobium fredii]|uniref:hypothetical protein n=1 Tax=Rhizobium fredii TaxID=380 RepID=UPI003515A7EB